MRLTGTHYVYVRNDPQCFSWDEDYLIGICLVVIVVLFRSTMYFLSNIIFYFDWYFIFISPNLIFNALVSTVVTQRNRFMDVLVGDHSLVMVMGSKGDTWNVSTGSVPCSPFYHWYHPKHYHLVAVLACLIIIRLTYFQMANVSMIKITWDMSSCWQN